MEESKTVVSARLTLPVILIAAVVQGWSLFGLHHAIKSNAWPATDMAWLIALYALAVFIPATVQLLAEYARSISLWVIVAIIAAAFFYFGWHNGTSVYESTPNQTWRANELFPLGFISTVLWLLLLPFVQSRLALGSWRINYSVLFASAWRNKLVLAEAVLFTGLFWLLLFLWASLFHMLGIDYFKELFQEPIFVYPITSLTFGIALHLIGSIERLTAVVLEQILNVLKWLAIVAGFILVLFSIALAFKLPGVVFTGQRAIGAVWLLWLVAVIVLLFNAAYRDGSVAQPYPKWIGVLLKSAAPLTIIISFTALYALVVRTQHYGVSVERVWAFIVAGAALIYSIGYSASLFSKTGWLPTIARVNVIVAIALIVAISAALTPLISPYRLAADSQFRIVQEQPLKEPDAKNARDTPFHYLRFDAGHYGRQRLQQLAELQNHPSAARIRELAKSALAQENPWVSSPAVVDVGEIVAKLPVFPAGRALDAKLAEQLLSDLRKPTMDFDCRHLDDGDAAGIFIDLDGDNIDEFVFLTVNSGLMYQEQESGWKLVAKPYPQKNVASIKALLAYLNSGNFAAVTPVWKELSIGGHVFRLNTAK